MYPKEAISVFVSFLNQVLESLFNQFLYRQDDYMNNDAERVGVRVSNRTKDMRMKKRRINNIIHNFSWVAESSTVLVGLVFVSAMNDYIKDSFIFHASSFLTFLMLYRVWTPFIHLFNEQKIKITILEHGWICAIKAALMFPSVIRDQEPNRRNSYVQAINTISSRDHAFENSRPKRKNKSKIDPVYNRTVVSSIEPTTN